MNYIQKTTIVNFVPISADAYGDSRRVWYGEVSCRVREVVLHSASSAREWDTTAAKNATTERRDWNQRGQRQRRSRDDTGGGASQCSDTQRKTIASTIWLSEWNVMPILYFQSVSEHVYVFWGGVMYADLRRRSTTHGHSGVTLWSSTTTRY